MEIWKGSRRVFQRESDSTGYREACFEKLEKNGAVQLEDNKQEEQLKMNVERPGLHHGEPCKSGWQVLSQVIQIYNLEDCVIVKYAVCVCVCVCVCVWGTHIMEWNGKLVISLFQYFRVYCGFLDQGSTCIDGRNISLLKPCEYINIMYIRHLLYYKQLSLKTSTKNTLKQQGCAQFLRKYQNCAVVSIEVSKISN